MGTGITIVELPAGSSWWQHGGLTTLVALRPALDEESLLRVLAEGADAGLRYHGAVVDSRCVGVAGWRMLTNTAFGRCAYIEDLVVDPVSRSAGVGRALLAFVTDEAVARGAAALRLDSAVHRAEAHRFYFRERMHVAAFHFLRRL